MSDKKEISTKEYQEPFGVEIELNSFDNRDFVSERLRDDELPKGAKEITKAIKDIGFHAETQAYGTTSNNPQWVIKPDRSCGIEVCSPVLIGESGISQILSVVDKLKKLEDVKADGRCSLHMHLNVESWSNVHLLNLLVGWVKCESVFLDAMPIYRKKNRYCQQIGIGNLIQHDSPISYDFIFNVLSYKYLTLNTTHYKKGRRSTIEYRIAGNEACLDKEFISNWIRTLLHFSHSARIKNAYEYVEKDRFSGYLWLDPIDVFEMMNYFSPNLSSELKAARSWLLSMLRKNIVINSETTVWSPTARSIAIKQLDEIETKISQIPK